MKEPKKKAQPVKSARKTAKDELKGRLLTTLKTVLDQDKIKLTKKIKKQSKKLFKTVVNELTTAKDAVEKIVKPAKTAPAAKAPKEDKTKAAAAPAKAAPVKKAAAPAKPAAKAAAVKPAATKAKTEKK